MTLLDGLYYLVDTHRVIAVTSVEARYCSGAKVWTVFHASTCGINHMTYPASIQYRHQPCSMFHVLATIETESKRHCVKRSSTGMCGYVCAFCKLCL